MRHSDELYQLIRSLTRSERRYFKLFASIHGGEKNYLRLFDAIAAQEEYDEPALKEQFRGERFIRQFNIAKKYLYDLILKSLRVYHTRNGGDPDPRDLIRSAEILFKKGLTAQANKMACKATEIATKNEDFFLLMQASTWRAVADKEAEGGFTERGIESARQRDERLMQLQMNLDDYAYLLESIGLAIQKGPARSPEQHAALSQLMAHPLLLSEEKAMSLKSRILYHWCHGTYRFGIGEYEASLRHIDAMIAIFETHETFITSHPTKYVAIHNNRLYVASCVGDDNGVRQSLEKLKSVADRLQEGGLVKGDQLRSEVFLALYLNRLCILVDRGDFEECLPMVEEIEEGLRHYDAHLAGGEKLKFLHNLARLYFCLGRYDKALEYNNMIIVAQEPVAGPQNWYAARLLELIIHYELRNFELLEYRTRSAYRWLRSRNVLFQVESILLEFFRRVSGIASNDELTAAFRSLRERLLPLEHDPYERNAFIYFHYIPWLDSKIDGVDFAERIRSDRPRREWGKVA